MNKVTIQRTKFIDYDTESASFGVRVYDEYGLSYVNTWTENQLTETDEEVFNRLADMDNDPVLTNLIEYALEHGCYVDSRWYDANTVMGWRS